MNARPRDIERLKSLLARNPVVGILGARQVGKSTLARLLAQQWPDPVAFFDLEDEADLARLADPMLALRPLRGLVVLDEIQRRPNLFASLRVLADRAGTPCRFLILGSAAPAMLRQSAESLAGRIAYHHLDGFSVADVGADPADRLWRRGGFPRSYLADTDAASAEWRRDFVRTFIERDIPQLGVRLPSQTLRRFWSMLAHYHGQTWNASEFARSFGVADTTVRHYLDTLASALVVRLLLPWHANVGKRQIKAPKVYVADPGLLHCLLNLPTQTDLERHPKVGASWEGFMIQQVTGHLRADPEECFHWGTYSGAEIDLVIVRGRIRRGFEIKRTSAPAVTPSMRSALADLDLESIDVIHAGDHTFPMHERIRAVSASRLLTDIEPLPG